MGLMADSSVIVEEEEDLIRVPAEVAVDAWQWVIDHKGTLNDSPESVLKTTRNLEWACKDGRTHLMFIMNHLTLTPNEKMMFKLIFAG